MDLIESFGFNDVPLGGPTNYNGQYWHSDSVGGVDNVNYTAWNAGMASAGISNYDAAQYHIWTWWYKSDDTYVAYVDGIPVQNGTIYWTYGGTKGGTPINMSFIFDGSWGSTTISSLDYSLPASALAGTYYEWNYSRVYLRLTLPPQQEQQQQQQQFNPGQVEQESGPW
jgi:hypothetical protein